MKKTDVFTHIWPESDHNALVDYIGEMTDITRRSEAVPMIANLEWRFEVTDMFGLDYCKNRDCRNNSA